MINRLGNKTKQFFAGLMVIGLAMGASAFTTADTNQETHYWYQKNVSTGAYSQIGSGMTTRPTGLCPEEDGQVCAKGFSSLQNAAEINDNTPAERTAFRN